MKKLSYGKQHVFNNSKKHIIKSLFNQTITQGEYLKIFENKICKYLKVKNTLVCNSGTAALHMAFHAINLQEKDNILMPSINFIAAYNMAKLFKAKIHLIDVDKETGQICIKSLIEYLKKNIGKKWMIDELAHKPFPSGRLTHGLVHAIKDLKLKHKLTKDDIKSVICHVPPGVFKLVSRPIIKNLTTNYAKLCAKFVGASYMINDHLNIETFTEEKYLNNKETHEFASKIVMTKNDQLDEKVLTPQLFYITLANNEKIEINLDNVYGHPKVPLSEKEYLNKFRICCTSSKRKINKEKVNEMIDFILDLENKDNVIDFFKII